MNITLQQMITLDAVIREKGIQAAAKSLNKTHPSVIAILKKLEGEVNFPIFDRSGYRLALTDEGSAFYKNTQRILSEMCDLEKQVKHLNKGEETELNIVIGDLTPIPEVMTILRQFSAQYPSIRLNFLFENLYGPNEQLLQGNADLIIHHIDQSDPRYEYQPFCSVDVIPVAAPNFFDFTPTHTTRYTDLKGYTQCIIRDTAEEKTPKSYFVMEDSPHITVGDQRTKKEIIVQRMAWGHMPLFLVEDELKKRELISLRNQHLQGSLIDIVVARRSSNHQAVMANHLWSVFSDNMPV